MLDKNLLVSVGAIILVFCLYFYPSHSDYDEYVSKISSNNNYQTNVHTLESFIDPKKLAELDSFENEEKFEIDGEERDYVTDKAVLGKIPQNHTNVILFKPLSVAQKSQEKDIQTKRLQLLEEQCHKYKTNNNLNADRILQSAKVYNMNHVHHTFMPCNDRIVKTNFTYCIPLKTGTTNIQRFIARNSCANLTEKKLTVPGIFYQLPRLSDYLKGKQPDPPKVKEIIHSDMVHGLSVRHPFARLASAYRQKFETSFYRKNFRMYKVYGEIMQKYDELRGFTYTNDDKFIASFEAFLVMISESDPRNFNIHWKTYVQTCSPCEHKYNFISKTETADVDSQYFAETYLGIPTAVDTVYGGQKFYAKGMYEGLPKQLIDTVYNIYKRDFELFGYSLDDSY